MKSVIHKKFYNLFWNNQACYNMFLLSKEELLDSNTVGSDDRKMTFTTNKILVSNADQTNSSYETIKYRLENFNLEAESEVLEKLNFVRKIIETYLEKNYKESFEKLMSDIEKKPLKTVIKVISALSNDKKREKNVLELLRKYNFVPHHLENFKDVESHFLDKFKPSTKSVIVNDENVKQFFEGIKFVKDLYVSNSYKKLYSANENQVLFNSLRDQDDYTSRIQLYHLMYEADLIKSSDEDAFIECCECPPKSYRGVFQLRIDPKKMDNLKCPICSNELTYFIPFELHLEIYDKVKRQDGIIIDALEDILKSKEIVYKLNQRFLDNIELDCIYKINNQKHIVECKMYKLMTEDRKLKSKVKTHYFDLIRDLKRLREEAKMNDIFSAFLLVNIQDKDLLSDIIKEVEPMNEVSIISLKDFKELLNSKS